MASRSTKTTKNDPNPHREARVVVATARDFTVADGVILPDVQVVFPGRHVEVSTGDEETLAFDTAAHDLARAGVSLIRHSDPQPGWRLRAPDADVYLTSGARARTVPAALAGAVSGLRRGADLIQTGSVKAETRTLTIVVQAPVGEDPVTPAASKPVTLVDTTTHVVTGGDEARLSTVRQVTLDGDDDDVAVLRAALLRTGAVPVGEDGSVDAESLLTTQTTAPTNDTDREPESLGDLVLRYLSAQLDAIVLGDLILRTGRPSVHRTRVALRRARSTLRTFARVFDTDAAVAFSTELQWYAQLLGEVRDRDVLHDRLIDQIAGLDERDLLGPVASHVESTLASERGDHLRAVHRALDSERYAALLTSVEEWRTAPLTEYARRPAVKARKLLRTTENRLDRRLADVLVGETDLHPARKAAKRLRYAAELSEPVLGKVARKTVKRNEKLQTMMGEHQDSVVSGDFLRRIGAAVGTSEGHNGYTYGVLAAHEQHRALRVREQVLRTLGG